MFPLRDTQSSGKFPIVNLTLILTNLYIFFLELTTPNLDLLIQKYALTPNLIDLSDTATLTPFLSSLFLHAGFLHILSNMWFLWIFGDNVEAKIGHFKYLFFYLFCGITASLAQYIFIPTSSLPMLGASGAIAGVLGAYAHFFPHNKVDTIVPVFGLPLLIAVPASFMLIYWFLTQAFNGVASIFVATTSIGTVAYIAHTGGFLSGLVTSRFFNWSND